MSVLSFAIVVAVSVAACRSVPMSPTRAADVSPTRAADDIVVTASQFGQTITVPVDRVVAVPRPAEVADWQVDYSPDVLQALAPADAMRTPGAQGWRFKAVHSGETDLVFTAIVAADPRSPGLAAPRRFTLTVRVP